jgi:phosphate-selective porin OprO/OprP
MIINKIAKILVLGTAASLSCITAQAADKELLDILLQNGSINQLQYNSLLKKETISKKDVNSIITKLDKNGLQFETADKKFKMKFGGRLHADASFHSGDNDISGDSATNGTEIRRARLYIKGVIWDDFKYMSEFDFADNQVAVKDLFVTYTGLDWLDITAGHQKQAISMELQESSNDIMFIERSLVNTITASAFDRAIGLNLKSSGKDWSAQMGAYGESINSSSSNGGDEGWGISSRVTYAPINTKNQVVHLGAYGGFRETSDNNDILNAGKDTQFSYETTHSSNLKLTNTGKISGSENLSIAGFEAAYMQGPFSVQGEYAYSWLTRDGEPSVDFNAFYVQAGWTLTGESRSYKGSDGEFKRLKPAKDFSLKNGGWGALELAARYDQADMSSGTVFGGSEKAVTIALNWYLNQNVRLMANYRRAFDVDNSGILATENPGDLEEVDTFSLRGQWAF